MQNELYHHGILGQRWGVRRFQNEDGSLTAEGRSRYGTIGKDAEISSKQLAKIRKETIKKKRSEDLRTKQLEDYERQINYLLDHYNFDADDGGGGETEADEQAGKRYMELNDEYQRLEDEIERAAKAAAKQELLEKYGEVRISKLKTRDNVQTAASVAVGVALVGALMTHPIATVGITAIASVSMATTAELLSNKARELESKRK